MSESLLINNFITLFKKITYDEKRLKYFNL